MLINILLPFDKFNAFQFLSICHYQVLLILHLLGFRFEAIVSNAISIDIYAEKAPFLQRISSSDWKATATNLMHTSDLNA